MDGLAELLSLDVRGCSKLEELPGIETLVSLTRLVASGCVKLKSIRGLRQLTKLLGVTIKGCSDLEEVEGIQHCMSLEYLDVTGCPKLRWSAGVVEQLRQRSALRLTDSIPSTSSPGSRGGGSSISRSSLCFCMI
uniref:Uncharacterized protein n=1 Tax=Picea sitchensis TaxID=3332 RepID=D5A960_PICSI|nr:unknown [Picea sitchensis]